MFFFDFT